MRFLLLTVALPFFSGWDHFIKIKSEKPCLSDTSAFGEANNPNRIGTYLLEKYK